MSNVHAWTAVPAVVPGKPSKVFVGVLGCMVTAPSRVKDLARDFLENYLMSVDGLRTEDERVALHVVEETPEGVIVSGGKQLSTAASHSNECYVALSATFSNA